MAPTFPVASTKDEKHKRLPTKPMGHTMIRMVLNAFKTFDMNWKAGGVFAYVYPTRKHAEVIAKEAYMSFVTENALDPTVFPSVMRLETEVVSIMCRHLRAPMTAVGNFTTGGTESIFLAVKAARDYGKHVKGIEQPELVLPMTGHAAFHKAAYLMGVKLVVAPCNSTTWKADVEAVDKLITSNTIMIVGSAVSYAHGVCDPIPELGAVAEKHDVWLHVDGCIGGWVLPYYRKLGVDTPKFDFEDVPAVCTVSVDLHKYAFCPKPASVVVYKNKELRKYQLFACSEWPGYTIINTTFLSTKSGGPVAAAWASLHAIGEEGYMEDMRRMLVGTQRLVAGIKSIPVLRVTAEPESNLISFTSDKINIFRLCDVMKDKGWFIQPQLSYQDSPVNAHISVNPQADVNAAPMIKDLAAACEEVKNYAPPAKISSIIEKAKHVKHLTRDLYEELMRDMGLSTSELPEELAEVNMAMDALCPEMRAALLIEFANDLFQHDQVTAEAESQLFMQKKMAEIQAKAARYVAFAAAGAAVLFVAHKFRQ